MVTWLSALRTGRTLLPRNIVFMILVQISVRLKESDPMKRDMYTVAKYKIDAFSKQESIRYTFLSRRN
jgi:hypothetical protein